jgi:hypothetical protein
MDVFQLIGDFLHLVAILLLLLKILASKNVVGVVLPNSGAIHRGFYQSVFRYDIGKPLGFDVF